MASPSFVTDLFHCLRFYSRLPLPEFHEDADAHAMFDFCRAAYVVPIAGAVIGLCGALVLLAAALVGLPPLVAALLSLATLVVATGAFHEDGLADCADSFGGTSRAEKLAILKDSRIGTFGASALVLGFALRAAALAALMERDSFAAAIVVVAAAALSRGLGLMPLALLEPARADGAGSAAGKPIGTPLALAGALAVLFGFAPLVAGFGLARLAAAILAATAAAYAVTRVARHTLGGQTGDVAGTAQQLAEIAYLCVLVAIPRF
jgi:adenosylcobinamide-GDP ribazoletransferase